MKKKYLKTSLLLAIGGISSLLSNAQTYEFTTCDSTGRRGPSQAAVYMAYDTTNLDSMVTVNTEGIQEWVVPHSGMYQIEVAGAQGGENNAYVFGLGATMIGEFYLEAGENLSILVGQKPDMSAQYAKGGGGGSFVWETISEDLLIAAGGGGGASNTNVQGDSIIDGRATQDGGFHTTSVINGEGGAVTDVDWAGGGGAGWNSNGDSVAFTFTWAGGGGLRPLEGGLGGDFVDGSYTGDPYGGFGGGGGSGVHLGGAGGGYTGGEGGGYDGGSDSPGGGGSFNSGTNQNNVGGNNSGEGYVTFTTLCSIDLGVTQNGTTLTSSDTAAASTYQWINCSTSANVGTGVSFTATANGDYSVIVTNGACSDTSDCISITSIVDTSDCGFIITTSKSGQTITADDTTSSLTFQWINCSDNSDITGETGRSFTATSNGSYAVIITDDNSCSDTTDCVSVTIPIVDGMSNVLVDNISISPNPTSGIIKIELGEVKDFSVNVVDITGKSFYKNDIHNSSKFEFNLNAPNGVYFVEISSNDEKQTRRIIKK